MLYPPVGGSQTGRVIRLFSGSHFCCLQRDVSQESALKTLLIRPRGNESEVLDKLQQELLRSSVAILHPQANRIRKILHYN